MDGVHLLQIGTQWHLLRFWWITSSSGAYRLVESESLLIPAKFLSGVQVQAVLKIIIAKNIWLCAQTL